VSAEFTGPEISAVRATEISVADIDVEMPWREALRPPTDSRRLLAARSAWAILALASGEPRFAARVAAGLSRPEASRARARLEAEGLMALLPLLAARAGRAWCTTTDVRALVRLRSDSRLAVTVDLEAAGVLHAYARAADLSALVDEYALHATADQAILLRPVAEPWPLLDRPAAVPQLVRALDLLELAMGRGGMGRAPLRAAWGLVQERAAAPVPSWYHARRAPRLSGPALRLGHRAASPVARALAATRAADADVLSALLFAAGALVARDDLMAATGWPEARLQAAVDALLGEPPRGQQVQLDGERLQLVTAAAASGHVERLLRRLQRAELLEPLELHETVWLVLAIVVLDQPITRAEITARRMADSDRQVQLLLRHGLVREEPRAALPGRGIPLVTTDLVPRRFGLRSIGELQDYLLSRTVEADGALGHTWTT
jgi:chromosome segregation and condensation protein ScpB